MMKYNSESNVNHNLIMMNRYCNDFHDGDRIFFCKIDHIMNEFSYLREYGKNCVLIIANGDITFDNNLFKFCPENVKHIFATNTTCLNQKVTPIPIGVEMEISAKRVGHGDVNLGIFEKKPYLTGEKVVIGQPKENKIYSNFNVYTNLLLRSKVKEISMINDHINFEFGISYDKFVSKVTSHIGTLSPRGNGIECIRTYEVLYLNSIPIVIGDYYEYITIYENIYKNLPIVFIDSLDKLTNFSLLEKEINKVRHISKETLGYDYWKDLISKKIKKIL